MKIALVLLPFCFLQGVGPGWADALPQRPDAVNIVRRSIANYQRGWKEAEQWRHREKDISDKTEVSEVTPLLGTPYQRLIERDGHPLSPSEERQEVQKFQKTLERRQRESASERAGRISKYEHEWDFLNEIPNAYRISVIGEESLNGRPAWIVSLMPRPDFIPKSSRAAMLKHIEGKLWIDKQELQWVKADAHVTDTISIGWILARVGPGAKIELGMTRVAENLWLPASIKIDGSAKVLMVHRKNLDEVITDSDYARVGKEPQNVSGKTPGAHSWR